MSTYVYHQPSTRFHVCPKNGMAGSPSVIWAPARSPSDCLVPSFWTGARWRAPSQWNGPTWGPWGPVTDVIEKKPWAQGQLAGKLYDNYDNYMIIMIL